VCKQILEVIQVLQKKSPSQPVTQKQVHSELKHNFKKPDLTDRTVRRAFRKLREDRKIIRSDRGQYWLRKYLKRNKDYLKQQQELEKEFYGTVNHLLVKRVIELEKKLAQQEIDYEDIIDSYEKQEILRDQARKKRDET